MENILFRRMSVKEMAPTVKDMHMPTGALYALTTDESMAVSSEATRLCLVWI